MPAAKDLKLLKGHWTKEQKTKKEKAKASVTPSSKLKIPKMIQDNVNLYSIWENTLKSYEGTELLNALDTDILTRYCIEKYALDMLYEKRAKKLGFENMLKLETRIEAKTKMLNQMATSLYMTPRARAGAIPLQPDKETKGDDPNAEMFD